MKAIMLKGSCALALLLSLVSTATAKFITPIGGVPYTDWTIVNYTDLDGGPGVLDWNGGQYTYDGHDAIDFTLPNFAAMDAGVDVYAADTGRVVAIRDGEYDRWSRVDPNPGDLPNFVVLEHEDGIVTQYLHLKRDSVAVSVGEIVEAGHKLGEVGSSGFSTDPHLHFAVFESGNAVETYLDPERWWESPLPYAGNVLGTLDYGITDHRPSTTELVNRPEQVDVFRQSDGPGQEVWTWMNFFGFKDSDDLDYYFHDPLGVEQAHWHWTTAEVRYGWWRTAVFLPDVPPVGQWTIEIHRNGSPFHYDSFLVVVPEANSMALFVLGTLTGLVRRN